MIRMMIAISSSIVLRRGEVQIRGKFSELCGQHLQLEHLLRQLASLILGGEELRRQL